MGLKLLSVDRNRALKNEMEPQRRTEWQGLKKWQLHTRSSYLSSYINFLEPTGHVTHHQYNIQQLYALAPHCIYVFCIYLRTNSDLCHLQHKLIGFYNRDLTLYSPVVTICTASITFNNCTLWPHTEFMCFVFIWEQTATCATYSINWLVFITQMKSVYSAVRTGSLNKAVRASSVKV